MLHSIVIPVFNEESGLEQLFTRIRGVIDGISEPCEVILVNDGSKDGSSELMDRMHCRDPRFKVIHFSRNFGHQAAITAGLQYSSGDTATVIDADLQDPPELIQQFITRWREGFEVVYGVRRTRAGETRFKIWTAGMFYRLVRSITQLDIPVDAGDFRLMDRKVVRAFLSLHERNRYVRGLVSWIGFRQCGVEYDRASRFSGETHYPLRKMLKLAMDGISSFSFVPLKVATWVGFFSSLSAAGVALWAIYLRFMTEKTIPGWTSLMLVMLFLGGAQLVAIGIIGEYLGRMLDEVRQRPLFLVGRLTGFGSAREDESLKPAA